MDCLEHNHENFAVTVTRDGLSLTFPSGRWKILEWSANVLAVECQVCKQRLDFSICLSLENAQPAAYGVKLVHFTVTD